MNLRLAFSQFVDAGQSMNFVASLFTHRLIARNTLLGQNSSGLAFKCFSIAAFISFPERGFVSSGVNIPTNFQYYSHQTQIND